MHLDTCISVLAIARGRGAFAAIIAITLESAPAATASAAGLLSLCRRSGSFIMYDDCIIVFFEYKMHP
eukprot:952121-Pleurochrysis_carterae.AAC.6